MSELEWMQTFADNLREVMEEQGYNQQQLADATGLSQSAIYNYIHAKRMPTIKAIINICYEMGLEYDDMIDVGERID